MNTKFVYLLLLWLCFSLPSKAQFDMPPIGGASMALGGVGVGLSDPYGSIHNLAGAAFLSQKVVGISMQQTYLNVAFSYQNCAFALPSGIGSWMVDYTHYGNVDYHEQKAQLGYSIALCPQVAFGVGLDYLQSGTSDSYYPNQNLITFSTGIQYRPTHKLIIGAHVFNPAAIAMNTDLPTRIPTRFNVGLGYQLCEELNGYLEVEKHSSYPYRLRMGIAYNYDEIFWARAGFATAPTLYSFGLGYRFNRMLIDLSAQVHTLAGFSPHISLSYLF